MNLFALLDRVGGRSRAGHVLLTYAIGAGFVSIVGQARELVTTSLRANGWQPPQPCPGCAEKAAAQLDVEPPADEPEGDPSPFAGDELAEPQVT